jgi:hypothetical protein
MQTKEAKRESDRKYRLKHLKELKEYRAVNKDKIREQRIQYDIDNAEKIKKQQKQYKDNHREEITIKTKQWRENNVDKIKQFPSHSKENRSKVYKKYHMNNKENTRRYKIKKKYDITLEQYNEMVDAQQGKCKICGTHQDELKKLLVIDHNHDTNIVRGLLCDKCNRGLGHFNDDVNLLSQAIEYLSADLSADL